MKKKKKPWGCKILDKGWEKAAIISPCLVEGIGI
jgi:hypothetical protein